MIGLVGLVFLLLAAFAAISMIYGVDSRDGSNDPRRGDYPVGLR